MHVPIVFKISGWISSRPEALALVQDFCFEADVSATAFAWYGVGQRSLLSLLPEATNCHGSLVFETIDRPSTHPYHHHPVQELPSRLS